MGVNEKKIAQEVANIFTAKKQRNTLIIVILILLVGVGFGFNRLSNLKTDLAISEQNEKALSDSVRYERNRAGDLVASKNILIADKNNLEDLNADLANELEIEKGKIREIIRYVTEIETDTLYIENTLVTFIDKDSNTIYGLKWVHDTVYSENNERHLAGISKFKIDSNRVIPLNTQITKDGFKFKIITGLREKDGNVEIFVRSDYPNFKVIELDGAIIDPNKHPVLKKFTKKKRFGVGPYVGLGLGVNTLPNPSVGIGFNVGIGIHYSLFRF